MKVKSVGIMMFLTIALIAVCFAAGLVDFQPTAFAADDSKAEYVLNDDDYVLVVGRTAVVVYFNRPADGVTCVYEYHNNANGRIEYVGEGVYFEKRSKYEISSYTLYLTFKRKSDENYKAFSKTVNVGSVNTGYSYVPVPMPEGQHFVYDGQKRVAEGVKFFKDGEETELKDAGVYSAEVICGDLGKVVTPIIVDRAVVTVKPVAKKCVYGQIQQPTDFDVSGNVSEADLEAVKNATTLFVPGLSETSGAGDYIIVANYAGEDNNFDVIKEKGQFVVDKAELYDFDFEDIFVAYDGLPHTHAEISYDEEKWGEVLVLYSFDEVVEIGKYRCTATVIKNNYNDLVLTAYVVIKSKTLQSNLLRDTVTLTMEEGFDPTMEVRVEKNEDKFYSSLAKDLIKQNAEYKDVIKGVYDICIYSEDEKQKVDGKYTASIRLGDITSAEGITIYCYSKGEYVEKEFTFENGEFTFDAEGMEGILFVEREAVPPNHVMIIVMVIVLGIALLLVLAAICQGFRKSNKEKKRWKKRRNKWV